MGVNLLGSGDGGERGDAQTIVVNITDTPPKPKPKRDDPRCSFCGKGLREVWKMVSANNGAYICNECVLASGRICGFWK